jgi:quercetin dioxygenase-like cupin family protein
MPIPFCDLRADYISRSAAVEEAMARVARSVLGQEVAAFDEQVARSVNTSADYCLPIPEPRGGHMNKWAITNLDLRPHAPEILASTDDSRAIALMIPAGESLDDHQVHERAWITVLDGEVEITATTGESVVGGAGLLVEFAPNERHAVHARSDARLLLLLTPWPGIDHPGAMTLEQKASARHDAAEHRANA